MATGTKTPNTTEEQDAAYNPGQSHYDEDFNGIARRSEIADLEASMGAPYQGKNGKHVDSHGDEVANNYNSSPDENINSASEQEKSGGSESLYKKEDESGGSGGKIGNLKNAGLRGKLKKAGPTGGIIGVLLFALIGVGGGSMTLGGSILTNLREIFHNDRSDGTRSTQFFSKATLTNMIGGRSANGCLRVNIKCKMSTFSEEQRKNYKANGFIIEGQELDKDGKPTGKSIADIDKEENDKKNTSSTDRTTSRYKVTSITFPDGKKVDSGSKFNEHIKANIKMRMMAYRAFNPKSAFYLNKKFSSVLEKFKLSKSKAFDGKDKKQLDDGFNEQTGGDSEEDNNDEDKKKTKSEEEKSKLTEKASKHGGRLAGGAALVQAMCLAYNINRTIVAGAKITRMYQLVAFAFPWLQAADQIRDGGRISPEKVDYLSSKVTYYENNEKITKHDSSQPDLKVGDANPKYGLSTTDSQGYKIAAMGDKGKLKSFAQNYLLGGNKNGVLAKMDGATKQIQKLAGFGQGTSAGRNVIRGTCIAAASAGAQALGYASCIGSIFTVVGAIYTGLCVAVAFGASYLVSYLIGKGLEAAMPAIIDSISNMNLGSDLKGVDAGNAMAAGAGLMLGANATGYGLKPASSTKEVQNYIAYTDEVNNESIAVEKEEAKSTPFDTTNKYTLLGSLTSKLQLMDMGKTPIFAMLANTSSFLSSAITGTSSTASALYSQPSLTQSQRYEQCDDSDLKEIGITTGADAFCSIVAVSPTKDLESASEQTSNDSSQVINNIIDYMMKPQTANEAGGGTLDDTSYCDDTCKQNSIKPSIDSEGKFVAGSQYDKYLKYCTDERISPDGASSYWGTTNEAVEEGSDRDQDWFTGKQCTDTKNSEMMYNFRTYTNYCLQIGTMSGASNCYENDTTPSEDAEKPSTCAGGGRQAIYTCALKYDNYQYEYGKNHGGSSLEFIKKFNNKEIPEWTPILDCSSLVRMAYSEAMGNKEYSGQSSGGYITDTSHWTVIRPEDAEQGDIIANSTHVAIIKSNNKSARKFDTFDAHTAGIAKEDQIGPGNYDYSFGTVLRAK